jgi:hypothetical protein
MDAECSCQHCSGRIAFPSEASGQSVECPHCKGETLLFLPPLATPPKSNINRNSALWVSVTAFFLLACTAVVLKHFIARHARSEIASAAPSAQAKIPQSPDRTAPPVKPVAAASNFHPIIGAFGLILGAKAPSTLALRRTPDGGLLGSQNTSEYAPFKEIVISTLDDGTIYQIFASIYGDEMIMNYSQLENTLTLRYGNPHFPSTGWEEFGSGTNRIKLTRTDYSATVYYVSDPLAAVAQAEQKARNIKKANENALGL